MRARALHGLARTVICPSSVPTWLMQRAECAALGSLCCCTRTHTLDGESLTSVETVMRRTMACGIRLREIKSLSIERNAAEPRHRLPIKFYSARRRNPDSKPFLYERVPLNQVRLTVFMYIRAARATVSSTVWVVMIRTRAQ